VQFGWGLRSGKAKVGPLFFSDLHARYSWGVGDRTHSSVVVVPSVLFREPRSRLLSEHGVVRWGAFLLSASASV